MEEITFQREALTTGNIGRLSAHERDVFYRKMVQGIVVLRAEFPASDGSEGSEGSDMTSYGYGSGFFYNDSGNILTCAHLLQEGYTALEFRGFDDNCFKLAKVLDCNHKLDLAILQPLKADDIPNFFLRLANPHDVTVGMECISIGHPDLLVYTMGIGEIAYPCKAYDPPTLRDPYYMNPPMRLRGHVKEGGVIDCSLELIQLSNLHGSGGMSGCPVFNVDGLVLGVFAISDAENILDFCIHVKVVKQFVEDYNSRTTIEVGSKKRRNQKDQQGGNKKDPKKLKGSNTMVAGICAS